MHNSSSFICAIHKLIYRYDSNDI